MDTDPTPSTDVPPIWNEAEAGKPLPVQAFPFKVATLTDGPAAGRQMRVSKRAILVPCVVPQVELGEPPRVVLIRYRRAPGLLPDGSRRYVHVAKDGAW